MEQGCELCQPAQLVAQNALAYARYDSVSLGPGHVLVIPFRHVANFFDMTSDEKGAVLSLLDEAKLLIDQKLKPHGFNIGANIGKAAGQSRMHVHVHLIPRFDGDVLDPRGGIRCVLAGKSKPSNASHT
jgi:diadenosine tetraphosphate (Ap4A) HIT family hydrolase